MQKPNKRQKLTSDNNIIKFKKPIHDPFKPMVGFDPNMGLKQASTNGFSIKLGWLCGKNPKNLLKLEIPVLT